MTTTSHPLGLIDPKLVRAVERAVRGTKSPVVLMRKGKPSIVVQDFASYKAASDSLAMLKLVVQSERSIAAGRTKPTKSVVARLRASVDQRRRG